MLKKEIKMKYCVVAFMTLICVARAGMAGSIEENFINPPDSARPGVYWYFMDGNQDREQMTADLEAMARVGLRKVIYLDVNIGVPRGQVDFMSEQWQDNFAHAVKTAERLGMEVILATGPGWAGSGGPWVKPEESMQHLVGNAIEVSGPTHFNGKLEIPVPPKPNAFHGMSKELLAVRDQWFREVAVLAFPTPKDPARVDLADLKTLKETQPYSIWKHVPRFVAAPARFQELSATSVINPDGIIDLTDRMAADGTLRWEVPAGEWTIMRFVARTTGQTTRPAPVPGHGFETDKFNPQAYLNHWDSFQGKLLEKVSPGKDGKGWTRIHLDSWEMSSQNWSLAFKDEFVKRNGYDPTFYYPAYAGFVVGSLEKTERFLWDLRKTAQALVIEKYAATIKAKAHEHGMLYSNQPYDMNPAGDIDLGSVADIPSCEFWDYRNGDKVDSTYGCLEAVSIAHTMGKPVVAAEAFTSMIPKRFHAYPGQMKNQTDWALAIGINNFIFHTFQHQPLGDNFLPGMSMGPFGLNWHRHQNWWDMLPAYHQYISRASHLLQQGVAVADILYLTPEGAPHIFLPPSSAMKGEGLLKDRRGYSFDAVSPRILMERATVKNGRIAFPEASQYALLILPDVETMTPEALKAVMALVKSGASIVGNPPVKSPSLVNYPECDRQVRMLAEELWGSLDVPGQLSKRRFGEGVIYWGKDVYSKTGDDEPFYPSYEKTALLLNGTGLSEDFSAPVDSLRFTHRRTGDKEIYFVSNRSADPVETYASFRIAGMNPELWHPETGERRILSDYTPTGDTINVPLKFAPYESYFVVFSATATGKQDYRVNFPRKEQVMELMGAWEVAFDPARGGPEKTTFDALLDWSRHGERGIKYYSGIATYTKTFDLPEGTDRSAELLIDLGKVHEMARVSLNGIELGIAWTAPWQLPVGSALKPKGNVLTVEVANSWENRLIGDTMDGDRDARTVQWESGLLEGRPYKTGRYTFTTYLSKAADFGDVKTPEAKLQPSGIIGPVTVQAIRGSRSDK